jgi:Fe-S oxidoreductase
LLTTVEKVLFVLIAMAALGAAARYAWRRYLVIRAGQPLDRFDRLPARLVRMTARVWAQICATRGYPASGLFHALIFFGFVAYVPATFNHVLQGLFSVDFLAGADPYLVILDVFSILVVTGVAFFWYRRFVKRSPSLLPPPEERRATVWPGARTNPTAVSAIVLSFIAGVMATYVFFAGFEFARVGHDTAAPVSNLFKAAALGLGDTGTLIGQRLGWWSHILLVLGFGVYIFQSKHLHLVAGPVNLIFRDEAGGHRYATPDLENSETFGAAKATELSWKHLLDPMSCIECGRCTDRCPAWNTGKTLNPKWLIVNLHHQVMEHAGEIARGEFDEPLLGPVIDESALWACTTCGACIDICPMQIEHVDDIIDIRREQVLMQGKFPKELENAFRGIENQANPWGFAPDDRMKWAAGLAVKTIRENPDPDVLYWVGCAAAYNDRAKQTARAFVKILQAAQVNFAVLGPEERCNGDPARRAGNEYLFQVMAKANIETLNAHAVKKIVTACPHCLNTLGSEYPDLGGRYEVIHHTEMIKDLIGSGRLKVDARALGEVTFHDPCYLGRHQGIFDDPRSALNSAGARLVEMPRSGHNSFCCGAGGAQMFKEEEPGRERVNANRYREAAATGAATLGVACPFCTTMLEDAQKEAETKLAVRDVAEIVADALAVGQGTAARASAGDD